MAAALRLGTRGSALALAQSTTIAHALEALGATVKIVTIRTSGDQDAPTAPTAEGASGAQPDRDEPSRAAVEDKARFVKELEQALLEGEIDLAVHSAKDVPGELPDGLEIVAVPERADPRDALCLAPHLTNPATRPANASPGDTQGGGGATGAGFAAALDALPRGATVGTASLRRRAGLLALRPDLEIRELRGNVDTRLRRLAEPPNLDAIVLAAAGLARLGRAEEGEPLPELALVPAAGQGCLALEARADDDATRKLACPLTDPHAFACLTAERTLVTQLGATCHTPVGAHATIVNHTILHLDAFVGSPDGVRWIREQARGIAENPQAVGADAATRLTAAGAAEILAAAEPHHPNA